MIATALIMGAAALVGVTLVIVFWNSIISYLKWLIEKVSSMISSAVLGVKVFLRKTTDKIMQITKSYSQDKETKKWNEYVVKRSLNNDEVPQDIQDNIPLNDEFDITDELENRLRT